MPGFFRTYKIQSAKAQMPHSTFELCRVFKTQARGRARYKFPSNAQFRNLIFFSSYAAQVSQIHVRIQQVNNHVFSHAAGDTPWYRPIARKKAEGREGPEEHTANKEVSAKTCFRMQQCVVGRKVHAVTDEMSKKCKVCLQSSIRVEKCGGIQSGFPSMLQLQLCSFFVKPLIG